MLKKMRGRINRRAIILLGFLVLIPLTILFLNARSGQSEPSPVTQTANSPQWKTYAESVADGSLEPTEKILEVLLSYDENAHPQITVKGLKKLNGYVPSAIPGNTQYRLQLLDANQKVLSEQPFVVPNRLHSDPAPNDKLGLAQNTILSHVNFAQTIAWRNEGKHIRIVDTQGNQILVSDLSSVQDINNQPEFRTIRGDELQNSPPQPTKQSRIFFIQSAHAQAKKAKLDMVFVSAKFTDMNAFHTEVDRVTKGFLQVEPMKTRASQFQFNTVDNTDDLKCAVDSNNGILCDPALIQQRIDKAGVPHDIVAVSINLTDDTIRASAGQFMILPAFKRTPSSVAHEFGHAFGHLVDEYVSQTADRAYDNKAHVFVPVVQVGGDFYPAGDGNCYSGNPPFADWANQTPPITTGDYRKGCGFPNWYASSQDSIMHVVTEGIDPGQGTNCYNFVSQAIINRRLDELVGPFPGGPVSIFPCPSTAGTPIVPQPTVATPSVITPTFVCGGSSTSICPTPTQMLAGNPLLSSAPAASSSPAIGNGLPIGGLPGGGQGGIGGFIGFIIAFFLLLLGLF